MIILVPIVFTACNNDSPDLKTNKVMLTDTTANYENNGTSDTAKSMHHITKSVNRHDNERTEPTNSSSTSGNNSASTSKENTSATSTTTTQKKGWSHKAKDAVIGGAVGAVGGAIISKKKGKGAIIGGIAGAAGGYIIGNAKDKKEGR